MTTFTIEELLGTKLRAMYQRKKVRDLFDMDYALHHAAVDIGQLLCCWNRYMCIDGHVPPTGEEFIENMHRKMVSLDYLSDMADILRPGVSFDVENAYAYVETNVIERINFQA